MSNKLLVLFQYTKMRSTLFYNNNTDDCTFYYLKITYQQFLDALNIGCKFEKTSRIYLMEHKETYTFVRNTAFFCDFFTPLPLYKSVRQQDKPRAKFSTKTFSETNNQCWETPRLIYLNKIYHLSSQTDISDSIRLMNFILDTFFVKYLEKYSLYFMVPNIWGCM